MSAARRPGAARGPRRLAAALRALVVLCALQGQAWAQTPAIEALPSQVELQQSADTVLALFDGWEVEARRAEEALQSAGATTATFEVLRETLAGDRAAARALADRADAAAAPLRRELDALRDDGSDAADGASGGASLDPPPGLVEDIQALEARIQPLNAVQRRAERAYARADALIAEIDDLIRGRKATELLAQGPPPVFPSAWAAAGREYADLTRRIVNEVIYNATRRSGEGERLGALAALAGAVALAAALAFVVRGRL
ncbi:MAG: DUF3772 domain-containing protein, partial [Pseudomonadota bacterium]